MRKISALLLCAALAVSSAGCSLSDLGVVGKRNDKESSATEETTADSNSLVEIEKGMCKGMKAPYIYKNALEGDEKIIVNNKEVDIEAYINDDYMYSEDEFNYGNPEFRIEAYMVCDLDAKESKTEKYDEVIIKLCAMDTSFAVLHYEDGQVYGYEHLVGRGFEQLKTDGAYMRSGGATYYDICYMSFDKSHMIESPWIEREDDKYWLNGKSCTESEFNKKISSFEEVQNVEEISFATPLSLEAGDVKFQTISCWDTRKYSADLDCDGSPEVIKIEGDYTEYEEFYSYVVYVNDIKVKSFDTVTQVGIGVSDIDTNDSIVELSIYSQVYDDCDFQIYKYENSKLINLNEDIKDNHIKISTKGDGILEITSDYDNQDLGCFFLTKEYKYDNGYLVEATTDYIYELSEYSTENKYILNNNIAVYTDSDCKKKSGNIKAKTKLTISRVKYVDEPYMSYDYEMPGYYSAAEVNVNGKVMGWIKLPKEDHDWGEGIFMSSSIPAWD